jgi:tetratricopeptide (TPR) repeat protein
MTPYVSKLNSQIQLAQTSEKRARAEAELACYWARVGEFAAANEIRSRLRSTHGSGEFPSVSIILMCLDGLIHFYTNEGPAAQQRIAAAHLLACSLRLRPEQAFSAAWLSHVEFNRGNWRATVAALDSARAALTEDDLHAEGKLSLVVGDALLYVGETELARGWYAHARKLLTSLGDHAAIQALLYNWAALRVHAARLEAVSGDIDPNRIRMLGGEVSSAVNYQAIANLTSLGYLLDFISGSQQVLAQSFEQALETLSRLSASEAIPKHSSARTIVLADKLLCEAMTSEKAVDDQQLAFVVKELESIVSPDDAAIIADSISRSFVRDENAQQRADFATRARKALASHSDNMQQLRVALNGWIAQPAEALGQRA